MLEPSLVKIQHLQGPNLSRRRDITTLGSYLILQINLKEFEVIRFELYNLDT
jgi:hypothetical protein